MFLNFLFLNYSFDYAFILQAYKNWKSMEKYPEKVLPGLQQYTAEQLFFISFGQGLCSKADEKYHQTVISLDVHSPKEFR